MTYYNTTGLINPTLAEAKIKAAKQEDILYDFFKNNPFGQFTRTDLENRKILNAPTASYVRALNTLMNDKKIVKLKARKIGGLGQPQHLWALKAEFTQSNLFG